MSDERAVKLDINQWQYIINVLATRPYREVAELMNSFNAQLSDPEPEKIPARALDANRAELASRAAGNPPNYKLPESAAETAPAEKE